MNITCPVCSIRAALLYRLHDDRYGYPGSFPYHRCPGCGLIFLGQTMDEAVLTTLYSDYYPRSILDEKDWKPYAFQPGFKAWLQGYSSAYMRVPPRTRVLDIGCGFGGALGYHRDRGCDVHGTELDHNAKRVAEAHGLDIRCGPFEPGDWPEAAFDYVTLDQVLEHNRDALPLLQGIRRVLKPGGRLVFTTPNARGWTAKLCGRRWIHWHPPYHVCLHTRRSLRLLLTAAGFVLDRLDTVTSSPWLTYQIIHLATLPEVGQPSPFWDQRYDQPWTAAGLRTRRLAFWLQAHQVTPLVCRLFDALGIGDNFVGEAKPCP